MSQEQKPYNLEDRTLAFSKRVIQFCKKLPVNTVNIKLVGQLIDAATSVGANYREANEALSKKDFVYRMRITRKEAKESSYWLLLIEEANPGSELTAEKLYHESKELRNIFSSIIRSVE